MVFIRRKDARQWERPPYAANSNYITVTLHFGGKFVGTPNSFYVDGDTVVYDWVKVDEFRVRDLDEWSTNAGFKFVIDDDDLRTWASKCLKVGRQLSIYVELLPGQSSEDDLPTEDCETFEDDEYVIGNEILSSEDDDEIFEKEVDGDIEDVLVGGNEVGTEGVMRRGVRDQIRGDEERGKRPDVGGDSSESECEVDKEIDVVAGDVHDFEEQRVSDEENDEPSYPVFNPKTTFNPEFCLGQIFANKKDFKVAAQSDAIKQRRNIEFPKNDSRRIYAKCCDPTCP
ncbi:hypothetical protein ACS0TY_027907 [Phlomoides rotata]